MIIEQIALITIAIALTVITVARLSSDGMSRHALFSMLLVAAIITTSFIFMPVAMVLSFPWVLILFIGGIKIAFVKFRDINIVLYFKCGKYRIIVMACIFLFAIVATTCSLFLMGLILYTVITFFSSELEWGTSSLQHVSILFHSHSMGFGMFSNVILLVSVLGALIVLCSKNFSYTCKAFSKNFLAFEGLILFLGLGCSLIFSSYKGIASLYFEWYVWPVVFIFNALALEKVLVFINCTTLNPLLRLNLSVNTSKRIAACAITSISLLLICIQTDFNKRSGMELPYRQGTDEIAEKLSNVIGLAPGMSFRGSAMSFIGSSPATIKATKGVSWIDLFTIDLKYIFDYGNDYRATGLWLKNIPTLFEYNQQMTPQYYYATSRFFSRPIDKQRRTLIVLTQPDLRLLALLGVRYILTDFKFEEQQANHAELFHLVPVKTTQDFSKNLVFLYEISNANTGSYSPTNVVHLNRAKFVVDYMKSMDFNPTSSVIINDNTETPSLVTAHSSSMIFDKDVIRVSARSEGNSLLVLPVQYSNCVQIVDLNHPSTPSKVLRANFFMSGILFNKDLYCELRYKCDPFINSTCRLKDYSDMLSMGLGHD